jgi:hypothetical protein
MHNSKNIKVSIEALNPSKGVHSSILPCQFTWRTTKEFIGESKIAIADMQEPIWWNRPLTSDVFCKVEEDGLCSYNFPFWQNDKTNLAFKTGYNVLLNKNSVPVAVHIKTDDTWTEEQLQLLKKMLETCLQETLIGLGVDPVDLAHTGNDFYFQGRKFSCSEQIFVDGVFTQNIIITVQMLPEKDIFDRLTGKYAHRKTITGIAEEVSSITKEAFIDKLYEKLCAYVEEHFN